MFVAADEHIAHHRTSFLRQTCLVETANLEPIEHRCGAKDLADRDDTGATNAWHTNHQTIDWINHRRGREIGWSGREAGLHLDGSLWLKNLHEAGAVTAQTRVIDVARTLIDVCLAPEFGLYRLHRQAVALLPTVATALAHALVDEHPKRGRRGLVAFAQTSLLGGAQLIVDQHRDTRNRSQPFLRLDHSGAVPNLNFVG
ncbi:unannotated protein [freshwater metagenome]|uniref:Unannotated protein n=1 Tax=freshwater metagenome TaxID=449393 RepID=A0A6J6YQP5_9ZZZZ